MVKKDNTKTDEENANDDELSITDDIRNEDYYHGLIARTDIVPLMRREGDFIVRKTEHNTGGGKSGAGVIVLAVTVYYEGNIRHFLINQDEDGSFYIEHHREKTVGALIRWHVKSKTPISSACGAVLKRAVPRPAWLLNHDSIHMLEKLGEGAFGEVYRAEYCAGKEKEEVAVKTMREEATRDARLKFMKEARLMRKLKHKNVVRIMGVALYEHPLVLVMELCPGGAVLSYLRKNKGKITDATKYRFAQEAAEGLAFLEREHVIHRDIAARNCLLSAKNEVKVSDFGMSDDKMYVRDDSLDKVPVKWLAPETMQNKVYTNKTDVWAYGVYIWEVYSEGSEPYPGLNNVQTRAKIVIQDYRMEMPKGTPAILCKLVAACWQNQPDKRPDFAKVLEIIKSKKM